MFLPYSERLNFTTREIIICFYLACIYYIHNNYTVRVMQNNLTH